MIFLDYLVQFSIFNKCQGLKVQKYVIFASFETLRVVESSDLLVESSILKFDFGRYQKRNRQSDSPLFREGNFLTEYYFAMLSASRAAQHRR